MKAPSLNEQRSVIRTQIATLRDSFTNRIGPDKGKITEPYVEREIECLQATLGLLHGLALREFARGMKRPSAKPKKGGAASS